jgi:hypothetical protein
MKFMTCEGKMDSSVKPEQTVLREVEIEKPDYFLQELRN